MNYAENLTKDKALIRENEIVLLNEQDVLGKKFSIAVFPIYKCEAWHGMLLPHSKQ